MNRLLKICLLLAGFSVHAETKDPIPWEDRNRLDWILQDNPKDLQPWAENELKTTAPEANPRRWVRALWVYAKLLGEGSDPADLRKLIKKGIVLAEKEGMQAEVLTFETLLPSLPETEEQNPTKTRAEYEALLVKGGGLGIKRFEAEASAAYAFFLHDLGESGRSLQLMLQANKLLAEDPEASELNRINMKSNLGMVYYYQKQDVYAEGVFKEIDAFCNRVVLRSFCAINDYNLGRLLVDRNNLDEVAKSEPYLRKALRIAQDIDDRLTQASAYTSLMTLYRKTRQFDTAIAEAQKAIRIFKEAGNTVWLADTYKKAARVLVEAQRYQEALKSVAEARRHFPEGFRRDFNELDWLSYQAYRGLGDTDKALAHLEKHTEEFKGMAEEREKSQFSKLMVDMGLQIEEERNKVLLKDNELKNKQLAETERMRLFIGGMLGLSLVVIASMGLAVVRSGQVRISRQKLHRILVNIDEGILTINQNMEIESEYSQHLQVLLDTTGNLTGKPALPLLLGRSQLNEESRSMVHEALHTALGSDELQWSFVEYHLPTELIYVSATGMRTISVHWQPLFSKNKQIDSILIGLKDVTDQRQLEAEVVLEKRKSDRQGRLIQELAKVDPERLDGLIRQTRDLLPRFGSIADAETRQAFLRELHTIKGIARGLGLKEWSGETHDFEDQLQRYPHSDWNLQKQHFVALVDDCSTIVQNVFGRQARRERVVRNLADLLHGILPELINHMQDSGLELCGLDLSDTVMPWPRDLLPVIEQVLVHALTNSVDHGFVLPKKRGVLIEKPAFTITARRLEAHVEIVIRDNGAGLDLHRLEVQAQRLGFQPGPGQSIADVVFLDGSSTAEQVSRTSGRGLGMAAIRSICQQAGGDVHLDRNPTGSGTMLSLLLPMVRKETVAAAS